jgi:adenylosuccinate lyase
MSVLRDRYASAPMREIWLEHSKVLMERKLWLVVMKSQRQLGVDIPLEAINAYEKVLENVNLKSIDDREMILHHDVKARIEEFNELAGYQFIHLGMTSRDVTENVEMFQVQKSLSLVRKKSLSLLALLAEMGSKYSNLPMVARTHNVPAQITTLGRRFSTWAEELLFAYSHLENLLIRLPIRGIKGAIGTSTDINELVGDSHNEIEKDLSKAFEFSQILESPAQIYPRSIDFEVVSTLNQIAATPSTIATNIRLMSGFGLVSEHFESGQTGSSAMPHKINPRLSERINSLVQVLKGSLTVISGISGQQWNEGDVSCSAARRVALPDSFYAIDAILDTSISVLNTLHIHSDEIANEVERFLPEIMSSRILILATKAGLGREEAHRRIKEHSLYSQTDLRQSGKSTFIDRVSADEVLNVDREVLRDLMSKPLELAGASQEQIRVVAKKISELVKSEPDIVNYQPEKIR